MNNHIPNHHGQYDCASMDLDDLLLCLPLPLRNHSRRVAVCSSIIAEYIGDFTNPWCDNPVLLAHLGGTCHDIGKLMLPALTNPQRTYRQHPVLGAELLVKHKNALFDDPDLASAIIDIVLHHHERPDKNGFPEGVGNVSLLAGICAIANELDYIFDLSGDPEKNSQPALYYIKAQTDICFSKTVVLCLEKAWDPIITKYTKWSRSD